MIAPLRATAALPARPSPILAGAGAGAVLAVVEVAYVALVWRTAVGGLAEAARFALLAACTLVPVGAFAGLAVATIDRAVAAALARRQAPARGQAPETVATAWRLNAYTVALAPLLGLAAWRLFTGAHARTLPLRPLLVAVCSGGALAAFRVGASVVARAVRRAPRPLVALAGIVAAIGLYLADQRVLHGRYAPLHAALGALALLAAALAVTAACATRRGPGAGRAPSRRAAPLVAACGVGAALVVPLAGSPTIRFLAFERTALIAQVLGAVTAAAPAAPPLPVAPRRRPVAGSPPAAAPRPTRGAPRDLVLITIDALRADHVGAYGYHRRTTPAIDAAARRGVVFDHAYAQVPNTSYSLASLLTGRYLHALAALGAADGHPTLAACLGREGYATAAFYPGVAFFVDHDQFKGYLATQLGFAELGDPAREGSISTALDAERRAAQVIGYLERHRRAPVFVWAHFIEPHEPYDVHPGFGFGAGMVDDYDGEIAYVDHALAGLLEYLQHERPEATVVIAADHGEELDDHGGWYHGTSLYEEQVRVPLVIAGPGIAPGRVAAPVQLLDLARTLLDLAGATPPPDMSGTDLRPWLAAGPHPAELPPAFAELGAKKLVASGPHRLICDIAHGFCELYDLRADPHELRNLAGVQPATVAALRRQLDEWLASVSASVSPAAAATSAVERQALARGGLGDRVAVPELARLLAHDQPEVRRLAARQLARLPEAPAAGAALRRALRDPATGPWAAIALGATCAPEVRRVLRGLPPDDPELAARAALALERCGDRELPLLAAGLEVDDAALRGEVVLAIGRTRDPRAVPLLFEALRDAQVRPQALAAVGLHGAAEFEPGLRLLVADPRAKVSDRRQAVRVLAQLAGRGAVPVLRGVLERPDRVEVQGAVVAQLAALRTLPHLVAGRRARLRAPHGELWVGVADGASGSLTLAAPAAARATVTLHGEGGAVRFVVPRDTSDFEVRGPAAFLFAR